MTTLAFQSEIDAAFGKYIENGKIECSRDQFNDIISTLLVDIKKRGKSRATGTTKARKKRKPANFMTWLNSGYRNQIKDEYFGDFDVWDDWSEEGIKQYYTKKELPLDKLEVLINKKKSENKEIKKPRLMSLITIKAGLIWKDMNEEEKAKYEIVQDETDEHLDNNVGKENTEVASPKSKKGRPAGYKPKNYSTDEQLLQALDNSCSDDESIAVEEFIFKGSSYMKDEAGNVYNQDSEVVGKYISDDNVEFV